MRNHQRLSNEKPRTSAHDSLCVHAADHAEELLHIAEERLDLKYWKDLHELKAELEKSGEKRTVEVQVESHVGGGFVDVLIVERFGRAIVQAVIVECKTWAERWSGGDVLRQLSLYLDSVRGGSLDQVMRNLHIHHSALIHRVLYLPEIATEEERNIMGSDYGVIPQITAELLDRAGVIIHFDT